MNPLLEVQGLRVTLPGGGGRVPVVDGIDYEVADGQVFGIAGESGSGKTISALALMGLLPPGARASGRARFAGSDLLSMRPRDLRRLCGSEIGIVFQDPLTSFHPMLSIGRQLTEHVRRHLRASAGEARARALALLDDPPGDLPRRLVGRVDQQHAALAIAEQRPRSDEPR